MSTERKSSSLIGYFVWQLLRVIISRTSVILLYQHHFNSRKINYKKSKCSSYIADIQGYLYIFCNYLSIPSLLTVNYLYFLLISVDVLFIWDVSNQENSSAVSPPPHWEENNWQTFLNFVVKKLYKSR